jgi:hypothetical protein
MSPADGPVKGDWPKVDPECRKLATHQRS